jgi:hypothetical protein
MSKLSPKGSKELAAALPIDITRASKMRSAVRKDADKSKAGET